MTSFFTAEKNSYTCTIKLHFLQQKMSLTGAQCNDLIFDKRKGFLQAHNQTTSFLTEEKDSYTCTIKLLHFWQKKRILKRARSNCFTLDSRKRILTRALTNDFVFDSSKDSYTCTIKRLPFWETEKDSDRCTNPTTSFLTAETGAHINDFIFYSRKE